jgi:hypothetical protein
MGTEFLDQLSLGTIYLEEFRLYLLGKAPFPPNARLYLHVANEPHPKLLTLAFPSRGRVAGVHRHKFYTLGLIFALFLGQEAPQRHNTGALNGKKPCILLRSWRDDSLFLANIKMARASIPVGVLRRSGRKKAE